MRFLFFLILSGCSLSVHIESGVSETPGVTFNKDIKVIAATVCFKCHHTYGNDWSAYQDAYSHRNQIYNRIWVTRDMPQGIFMNETTRALFRDWVNQGAKE